MKTADPPFAPNGHDEVFSTQRLWVGRWRTQDEAALLEVYGNRQVVRWVDDGQPLTPEEASQWIGVTRANYAKYGYGMYVIGGLSSGAVLGFGGLVHPENQRDAEMKYAFKAEAWGQGFATEFVKGLVDHASSVIGLSRIIATVAEANLSSQHVLQKCGFHHSETRKEDDGSTTEVFVWTV